MRMSLGTRLLLLHEVVPVFGCVFPNFHHVSRIPRALCALSHLCFPISTPCFIPCILCPSLSALWGLIPVFSTAFGSLSCICHRSNINLPCFSPQCSQSSAEQAQTPVPSHSNPCLSHRSGIYPISTSQEMWHSESCSCFDPIPAPWLWDCLVGVSAPLGGRIRARVGTGTEIKPSSGSCQADGAVGWGLELPALCPWQGLGTRRALISSPNLIPRFCENLSHFFKPLWRGGKG